jgi:DNA-binding response OmpR family regulator
VVDDLLEAERLEPGPAPASMQPQDLGPLLRASALFFEPQARNRSIEFRLDCPDSLPVVAAVADEISQMLSNLLSNALKYTRVGGAVQLSAEATASEVLLCVADNGPGIPRDQWDRVFERHARVPAGAGETPSVGLGLYIVRQIVDRHGGRVWVDSEVGKGSAFYVALPRRAPREAPKENTRRTGQIVVCDADPELATRMAQALRRNGFETHIAHSACRLLAQVVESRPSIVVTDILLPDMDSADLLIALNELKSRRPFRLVVHTYVGDALELRRRGADIVVSRPAKVQDLLQSVQAAAHKRSPSGATVLLLEVPGEDSARLSQLLLDSGYTPLVPRNPAQAAEIARGYPVDAVLVAEQALAANGSDLDALLPAAVRPPRIFILASSATRQARRAAVECGATLCVYTPGQESEVVAQIAAGLAKESPAPS